MQGVRGAPGRRGGERVMAVVRGVTRWRTPGVAGGSGTPLPPLRLQAAFRREAVPALEPRTRRAARRRSGGRIERWPDSGELLLPRRQARQAAPVGRGRAPGGRARRWPRSSAAQRHARPLEGGRLRSRRRPPFRTQPRWSRGAGEPLESRGGGGRATRSARSPPCTPRDAGNGASARKLGSLFPKEKMFDTLGR